MNKKFLKKAVAVTTTVSTSIALSGVSLFAPVFIATAASHIVDGDIIKTADNFDVYIVKNVGDKKFKRLILNPEVFNSYGHLEWGNIEIATQAEMDLHTTSELVRAVGDPKVYKLTPNGDVGTRQWMNMTGAEFVADGNDWDSIYEINEVDRNNYTLGSDIGPGGTTPTGTGVSVSLASDTPAATAVAKGASNHVFAKVNFVGGENTTVTSIIVTRSGLAADSDFAEIKLWDGATQLGATQALNTTTHKAIFTGLNWVVPAGTTKVLTITGSLVTGPGVGNIPQLGIAAASDIVATTAVSGTFPVRSNGMTIAGISVGILDVTVRGVPADNSPISGSVDQEIASWSFDAENEGASVRTIKITQIGSASSQDISNIKLKISGAQIGSTVSSLASDGTVTFDLSSSPVVINLGTTKIVYAYADIAAGITSTRTVQFEITNAADVTAFGANSVGSITITQDETGDSQAFTAQDGVAQTISQGTVLTVTSNGATNPTAQAFVRGETQVLISAFRFSNGAGEDQRVSRLRLTLGGTGAAAVDISNITLYKYDEATATETQVGSSTSFVSTTATYGANTTGLDTGIFDVVKSSNVVIHVRVDVSSSAAWDGLEIYINEVRVDGIQSQGDIGTATISAVDASGEMTVHSAALTVGTIAMATSPTSPAAQTIVPGLTGFEFGKFDFTMTGEDAILSSVTVELCDESSDAKCSDDSDATGTAATGDFTNVKLWNGSMQLGTTVASPSTAATFSFNLVLPRNETVTLSVTADVPTDAVSIWTASSTAVAIDQTITATGVSSSATIASPGNDALGNIMEAAIETLTVANQTAPAATVILNANQAVFSKIVLTAGSAGDVRVSSIKITASTSTTLDTPGDSDANLDFGTLKLVDVTAGGAGTPLGNTLSGFTNVSGGDTATFSGLSLLIPKGTQKVLELRANVLVADTTYYIGFVNLAGATTDVVATGLSSNTTVYGSGTDDDDSGAIVLTGAGALTVAVDAATPLSAYVAVGATAGKTGVDFAKWKFTATDEAFELESLKVTLPQEDDSTSDDNEVPNFAAIHLYSGSTEVSSAGFLTGTNVGGVKTHTFFFAAGVVIVPKDDNLVLTLRADLNGTSNGANSTTTPQFQIFDVTGSTDGSDSDILGKGVASGARVTSSPGTPDPSGSGGKDNQNEMTIVKAKPVFALCTASNGCSQASPSGALVPGNTEVFRFRITAEGDDIDFDGAAHNIRFTIAEGGTGGSSKTADLFEVGKTATLQQLTGLNLDSVGTLDFTSLDTTISKGTFKEYFVKVLIDGYTNSGDTFRLSLENTANDLSWGDGITADISIASITDGLPITGGTLVK